MQKVHFECVSTGLFTVSIKKIFPLEERNSKSRLVFVSQTPLVAKEKTNSKKNPSPSFLKHGFGYKSNCVGLDHRSIYQSLLSPATATSRNSRKCVNRAATFQKTSMAQYKPIRDFAVATDITGRCSNIQKSGIL